MMWRRKKTRIALVGSPTWRTWERDSYISLSLYLRDLTDAVLEGQTSFVSPWTDVAADSKRPNAAAKLLFRRLPYYVVSVPCLLALRDIIQWIQIDRAFEKVDTVFCPSTTNLSSW